MDHGTASLSKKLEELACDLRKVMPESNLALLDRLAEHFRAIGLGKSALKVGEALPPFLLPNAAARLVNSDQLLSHGPLVLSFFRGDWCPYCSVTLEALADINDEVRRLGGLIAGVTPDLVATTRKTVDRLKLSFDILSDIDSAFSLRCGVLYRVPDYMVDFYRSFCFVERHGNDSFFLPVPATYIVDRSGVVRFASVNADYVKRPEPAEILDALRAIVLAR